MNRPELRLFKTTAIKLAVKFVVLYGLLLLFVLLLLYWANIRHIDTDVQDKIQLEFEKIELLYDTHGLNQIIAYINQYKSSEMIYYLESVEEKKLAGNLREWPEDVDIDKYHSIQGVWIDEEIIPFDIYDDDAYWPVLAKKLNNGYQLLVAINIEQESSLLELSEFMLESLAVAIIFAFFIAILLSRTILKRMDIISKTAGEIMAGDLNQRIPYESNKDEFDTLAMRLNSMLDRIGQLVNGMREVTDNIAHDLRSPLNRMRSQMEVALLEPRDQKEYQTILRSSIQDIDSLIRTFNALLSIAQTESGNHRTQWSKINMKKLVLDLTDLYIPLAESKHQMLEVINGKDSDIYGSRDLLAQSLGNLLENAIKYTPQGGKIILQIKTTQEWVEVTVADSGPGIPDSEKSHVLEKFVRLEGSRNTGGNGLGLSLVSAVAKLHKAELKLEDANPGLRVVQRFNK